MERWFGAVGATLRRLTAEIPSNCSAEIADLTFDMALQTRWVWKQSEWVQCPDEDFPASNLSRSSGNDTADLRLDVVLNPVLNR